MCVGVGLCRWGILSSCGGVVLYLKRLWFVRCCCLIVLLWWLSFLFFGV